MAKQINQLPEQTEALDAADKIAMWDETAGATRWESLGDLADFVNAQPLGGDLDLGGNSITNVNLVDGVDIEALDAEVGAKAEDLQDVYDADPTLVLTDGTPIAITHDTPFASPTITITDTVASKDLRLEPGGISGQSEIGGSAVFSRLVLTTLAASPGSGIAGREVQVLAAGGAAGDGGTLGEDGGELLLAAGNVGLDGGAGNKAGGDAILRGGQPGDQGGGLVRLQAEGLNDVFVGRYMLDAPGDKGVEVAAQPGLPGGGDVAHLLYGALDQDSGSATGTQYLLTLAALSGGEQVRFQVDDAGNAVAAGYVETAALRLVSGGAERIVANGDSVEVYAGGSLALTARELLDGSGDVGLLASATVDFSGGTGTEHYDGQRVDVDASGTVGDGTDDPDGIGNTLHRWRVDSGSGLATVAALTNEQFLAPGGSSSNPELSSVDVPTDGFHLFGGAMGIEARVNGSRWGFLSDGSLQLNGNARYVFVGSGMGLRKSGSDLGLSNDSGDSVIEVYEDPGTPADGDTNIAVRTHQGAGPTAALQDVTLSALDVDGQRALTVPGEAEGAHSSMVHGSVQTTDGSAVTLLAILPEDGDVHWFHVHVAGARDGAADSAQAFLTGRITNDGGTIVIDDTTLDSNFSSASYNVFVDESVGVVRVRVQGDTGHTINWTGTLWHGRVTGPFGA